MGQMKKNYIYNLIYKVVIILFNVLTVPYLSRVLGTENIGVYSYVNSVVSFFMLFCLLGISSYGNRLIASVRDSKTETSKQFFSLYIVQTFCSIIACILYIFYIIFISNGNHLLLFIQVVYLLSALLDISWFFFGIEKFKAPVILGILQNIISFILILIFVRNGSDINKYVLIISITTLGQNLLLFPFLKKELIKVKITLKDILIHIKPCFVLFLPILFIKIYKIVNKIILGTIAGTIELGYFEQADKIIHIPLCIFTSLAVVTFPKMSNLISKGKEKLAKEYMKESLNFVMFLVFPICFGLISVADDFAVMFLGEEFASTGVLVKYLSLSTIFIAVASVIQNHYLICKKKDKEYVISVGIGSIINIILNIVLIPYLKALGAVIATLITEFVVTFIQIFVLRKEIEFKDYVKDLIPYFIKSIIMMLFILLVNYFNINNLVIKLAIQIIIGITIYFILNIKTVRMLLKRIKK